MDDYEEYFKHAKLINDLHAVPKELKVLENNTNIEKMEEEKPEKIGVNGTKKENDNRKKWMKRIWFYQSSIVYLSNYLQLIEDIICLFI